MKLLNFTIIKLTCCLITGIVISYLQPIPLSVSLCAIGMLLLCLFLCLLIAKKQFIKTIWFGLTAFVLVVFVGILTTTFHDEKNNSKHYTNFIINNDTVSTVTFRIRGILKPGYYNDKYVIDIIKIKNIDVTGKLLLNVKKDGTQNRLRVDDILIGEILFKPLSPALNPYQFDYKSYLEKQYIYGQILTSRNALFKVDSKSRSLFGIASDIRTYINGKLKPYPFKLDELAIINALLLGQRQDVSKAIYTNYTDAGAIHILAVSGLHVGILLLILSFTFKPIEHYKHGKRIKTVIIVTFLWCFALITGLSASVIRAVTMFSIIAIAMHLKRPTNIYNTLAISIFVILLFKPLFLFDVGFQLSYLAVFAIVIIDPILYALWHPRLWVIDKLWHTLTVTVSAQLGIIPISLFYFHQFPGLFFITNLVIIPFLGIILGFGLLIMLLASINLLPTILAQTYGHVIGLMNRFTGWVSRQDTFLLKDLPFNSLYVITSFMMIIAIVKLLKKRSYINLKALLIAILCFQCAMLYTAYTKPSNQFIIFHKNRYTLLGIIERDTIVVAHNFDSITRKNNNIIKDFTLGSHIRNIKEDTLRPVYILHHKKLLVVDSLGVYNVNSFQPEYVLLRQSPKINLNRLIDSIAPKYIIADGSNYKSYIKQWEAICKKKKFPFHQTGKQGAFIIDY